MADAFLSLDRLKALYEAFDPAHTEGWRQWYEVARAETRWAQEASVDELRSLEGQRRLWSLRGIATLGPGDSVRIDEVVADEELVDLLVSARDRHWPSQAGKRAQNLQALWGQLIERVTEVASGNRPKARLHRALFALLPRELHVGFSWDSHRTIRKLVIGQPQAKQLQAAVLVRERLRTAVGPEASLDEDVRRAVFLWWIYEQGEALLTGEASQHVQPSTGPSADPVDETHEPLVLLPFGRQYKGMFAFSGMLDGARDVVQAAIGGRTRDELVEVLRSDSQFAQWSPRSARMVITRLLGLGLLVREGGLYSPSDEGDRFLEDEASALIEPLFVRTYGFAQIVRMLAERPRSQAEVAAALRAEYPRWTTDRMAAGLVAWVVALGLASRSSQGTLSLTEYGDAWAARLPEKLPRPPAGTAAAPVGTEREPDVRPPSLGHPSLDGVWQAFQQPPHDRLIFTRSQVRALHAAWSFHPRKRFAILSGLSGTGKTELLLTYSHVVCGLMGLDPERHVRRVAVGPDWRDPTGLLGYFNALHAEPTFQAEPALRLVLDADANPDVPFFLVLDEMNLARVERYFAPFLSAMESDKDPHIQLHAHDDPVNDVPPSVRWPKNLRIGGTVNMDETTHPFSDKVLDRAFTLEFWDVDLPTFFARRPDRTDDDAAVEAVLLAVQDVLRPIRRHFGYRSADEVLGWVAAARASDPSAQPSECLDQALFSKVLPRLRGAQSAPLEAALRELQALCDTHGLPLCRAKVDAMAHRMRATGVTGFWS